MKKNKIETEVPEQRYTSYHSDKTFSILSLARQRIKDKWGFKFEYNGIQYQVDAQKSNVTDKGRLICLGPMYEYLMPWCEGDWQKPVLAEFDGEKFDEFIETFEIEGKTVRWILEHQKEWKYKLTAEHFEKVLTGFSFFFIYRGIPCQIYYSGTDYPQPTDGRYISLLHGVRFDPSQYAPTIPGAEHWFDAVFHKNDHTPPPRDDTIPYVWAGPFETVGELLDGTGFDGKTLREIFDTEYDDGVVLCGEFDV